MNKRYLTILTIVSVSCFTSTSMQTPHTEQTEENFLQLPEPLQQVALEFLAHFPNVSLQQLLWCEKYFEHQQKMLKKNTSK